MFTYWAPNPWLIPKGTDIGNSLHSRVALHLPIYACLILAGVLRFAKYIVVDLSELNSFMQQYGVSLERFGEYKELCSFFKVLTTSADSDNKVYVSTVHAHNYPITAFQWHPEEIFALRWNRSGEKIP
ncbi:hypothetical protein TEA_015860 [Camellia sinensis var. sinensis]|uniref:Glutamine amidotransferase domain-containing protein n=1 Tax=Camellia sinensis var. sinensis TaxID=542762 RepID=A0A4V6RY65_CAMSN|nr:hypothetical protein TEA_015860 [Camellia sinensis var. sinensis]